MASKSAKFIKACKVCKEGLLDYERHLLVIWFAFSAIRVSYDDILSKGDDLSVTLRERLEG